MPNTPLLTFNDNLDGTGATATVSGSSGGSTNVIMTLPGWRPAAATWATGATITGDGSANLALPVGFYWGSVLSSLAGVQVVGNLVQFAVTSSLQAVLTRIRETVKATIQGLSLTGKSKPPGIHLKKLVEDPFLEQYPAIEIDWTQNVATPAGGVCGRDDTRYPINIHVIDRDEKEYLANLPLYEKWLQQIRRAFINQTLPGVPEVYTCQVTVGAGPKIAKYAGGYAWYVMTLGFLTRELRGAGTGT